MVVPSGHKVSALLDRKAVPSDQGFEGGALANLPSYPCQIPMPFVEHSEPLPSCLCPLLRPWCPLVKLRGTLRAKTNSLCICLLSPHKFLPWQQWLGKEAKRGRCPGGFS